ncbi:MAG TPA: GntR family transcriptional regulator [Sphingomonas sp.]|nr:GntR family transcriptional regulator [Sphingomonas sp.]
MTIAQLASAQSRAHDRAIAPPWKTANPLFDAIVGTGAANTKAACLIAAQIEEDLIGRSWPTGAIYGSEAQLATKFGVCRVVVREAVRILESRGTARMRRGPNGGLLVLAPTMPVVLDAIHRYVTSHCGEIVQGSACQAILRAVHAKLTGLGSKICVGPGLIDFLEVLISAVDHYAREGAAGHVLLGAAAECARSRAEQIFRLLMKDLNLSHEADQRLGSELDLCDRYGADRNALRQAVRVLEFEGIAVSAAGRGKGLMTRTPEPTALCRLINCHFTAARVTPHDAMNLFKLLSVEAVSIAAERATDAELARLRAARRMLEASDARVTANVMQEAEESQFGIIDEPLVDILLRCTKSYSTWWSSIRNPESEVLGTAYRAETLKVISAIIARDATAAAAAQAVKVERLNRLI